MTRAFALLLAGTLGVAASARADRSFDVNPLRPTLDPYGMVATERAETPSRWEVAGTLMTSYTHAPLSLRLASADGKTTRASELVTGQVGLDVTVALGLADFLAASLSLPVAAQFYDDAALGSLVVIPQGTPSPTPPTVPSGIYSKESRQNVGLSLGGPRDPRIGLKARLYKNAWFGIGVLFSVTVPLGNASSFLGEKSATYRPTLVFDVRPLPGLCVAANVGAIFRPYSEFRDPVTQALLLTQSEELTFAAGVFYRFPKVVGLGIETFGTAPLTAPLESTIRLPGEGEPPIHKTANVDLLGTVAIHPTAGLRLQLSGGGGLIKDSPLRDAGRLLLSLSFSPSPRPGGLP